MNVRREGLAGRCNHSLIHMRLSLRNTRSSTQQPAEEDTATRDSEMSLRNASDSVYVHVQSI